MIASIPARDHQPINSLDYSAVNLISHLTMLGEVLITYCTAGPSARNRTNRSL